MKRLLLYASNPSVIKDMETILSGYAAGLDITKVRSVSEVMKNVFISLASGEGDVSYDLFLIGPDRSDPVIPDCARYITKHKSRLPVMPYSTCKIQPASENRHGSDEDRRLLKAERAEGLLLEIDKLLGHSI